MRSATVGIPSGRVPPFAFGMSCPFRKSYPGILVVQPGQDWDGNNDTGPLDRATQGRILAQRQVRTRLIVIYCIRSENSPQVRLTKDQQSVQALAAHGADQTFRIAILPGRSRRDRSVADIPRCESRPDRIFGNDRLKTMPPGLPRPTFRSSLLTQIQARSY